MIDAAMRVTGERIPVVKGERREGAPAVLVADEAKARCLLGWQPTYAELGAMIKHAWLWERRPQAE